MSEVSSIHRASAELLDVMERASEAVVYLPVERVSGAGNLRAPDVVAAIPVPLWEELVEKFDAFDTGWQSE